MTERGDLVLIAVIGAAHGLRGEMRARALTDDPLAVGAYGPLQDDAGAAYEVLAVRPAKNAVVMRLSGIGSREAAERLNGVSLYVTRDRLPDIELEEDEFFQTDLIGLAVRDPTGGILGTVRAVHDFGGGDILDLVLESGRAVMIPFSRAAVPEIDLKGGFVRVDPVAAGLDDMDAPKGPGSRKRRPKPSGGNKP